MKIIATFSIAQSPKLPSIYGILAETSYTFFGALIIPISTFQPSSTAGQTNQSAPTDNGPSQPANRGRVLAFAQKKREAVPTDPKMGTGRGWMTRVRAFNILLGRVMERGVALHK